MRYAKARRPAGELNTGETRYLHILEDRLARHEIEAIYPQPFRIKLTDDCSYTPDFMVVEADFTLAFIEVKDEWIVKGKKQVHWEEDAKVKYKVAREKYPCFKFVVAVHTKTGFYEVEK